MTERITTLTDERIANYSIALRNSLELERDIKKKMQEREKIVYRTIREETASRSIDLEVGKDLLRIAQGAAFGYYRELAFKPDRQINKETGEAIRVVDPDGKAIADNIISDMSRQDSSFESPSINSGSLRVEDPRV